MPVFAQRTAIMSMVAELESDKGRLKKLRVSAGGEFIPSPTIEYHLDIAQRLLEAAAPSDLPGLRRRCAVASHLPNLRRGRVRRRGQISRSLLRCCKRRPRRSMRSAIEDENVR